MKRAIRSGSSPNFKSTFSVPMMRQMVSWISHTLPNTHRRSAYAATRSTNDG